MALASGMPVAGARYRTGVSISVHWRRSRPALRQSVAHPRRTYQLPTPNTPCSTLSSPSTSSPSSAKSRTAATNTACPASSSRSFAGSSPKRNPHHLRGAVLGWQVEPMTVRHATEAGAETSHCSCTTSGQWKRAAISAERPGYAKLVGWAGRSRGGPWFLPHSPKAPGRPDSPARGRSLDS